MNLSSGVIRGSRPWYRPDDPAPRRIGAVYTPEQAALAPTRVDRGQVVGRIVLRTREEG